MHVDGQQRTIDQFQFGSVLFDEVMIMVKDGDSGQVRRWHIVDGEPRRCMAQPGHCPYGGIHYDDFGKASRAAERQNQTPCRRIRKTTPIAIEKIRRISEDSKLQSRAERASIVETRIPLPDRGQSAVEWKIALTNYRRFVAEGGHDPIPQGSSYRPNGVTRADAIHVAAKTIWMMREGRRIDQVDASSMNCVDDVNYHGVYRPLFGSSFADPRMEVDAAYVGLQSRLIDETLGRGLQESQGRWVIPYKDGKRELDDLSRKAWPDLNEAGRNANIDKMRDQMISFLTVDHKAIETMSKVLMVEPVSSGRSLKQVYDFVQGESSDSNGGLTEDDVILDSGRSLGDVTNSRTPAYTEVSGKTKADHPTNRSYDGRLPDSMIWNEDLKGTDPTEDHGESTEVDSSAGPRGSRLVDHANDGGTRSSFKEDDRRMIQGDLGF